VLTLIQRKLDYCMGGSRIAVVRWPDSERTRYRAKTALTVLRPRGLHNAPQEASGLESNHQRSFRMSNRSRWLARAMAVLSVMGMGTAVGSSQDSNLAQTPPMGWNSWNHFGCKVTDADVRGAAD